MLTISFLKPVFPASFEAIHNSKHSHNAFGSLERKIPCAAVLVFLCWRFTLCFGFCTFSFHHGFIKISHLCPLFAAGLSELFGFLIAFELIIISL